MTELNHSLKACEMTEDDFVYLADNVERVLEEKDKYIEELKSFIRRYRYDFRHNKGDSTQRAITKLIGDKVNPIFEGNTNTEGADRHYADE
jgi:hypothetical protein